MKAAHIALVCVSIVFLSCEKSNDKNEVVSQRYVHKYGFDLSEREWNERSREGKVITTLENGVVCSQNFVEGILQGETTYTFPKSPIVEERHFYNEGNLVKKVINNEKGLPVCEEDYKMDGRRTLTLWNEEGAPLSSEEFENDFLVAGSYYSPENEIEAQVALGEGYRTKRDPNGVLLSKDRIENGKLVARTTFFPSGEVQSHSTYFDYKLHGEQTKFAPNGQMLVKMSWDHGVLDGAKAIYKTGFKSQEIPYVKGQKQGIERRFDKEGTVIAEINWKNDRKHGSCRYFDNSDTRIEWYFNGSSVTAQRFQDLLLQEKFLSDIKEANEPTR